VTPAHAHAGADDAARRVDGLHNRVFLDPLLLGRYPDDVRSDLAASTDFGFVRDGDLATISAPIDFLGVNYYTSLVVGPGPYPGTSEVEFQNSGRGRTDMGWEVDPAGLRLLLNRLPREYGRIPLYIMENGSAYDDVVEGDGAVHDTQRLAYLASHLEACADALADGAPLAGYFAWSLMDNFEWALGYTKRFGLVHVDYETQQRRVKDSGWWFASFLERHGAPRP
jgi:beta-glucosidase